MPQGTTPAEGRCAQRRQHPSHRLHSCSQPSRGSCKCRGTLGRPCSGSGFITLCPARWAEGEEQSAQHVCTGGVAARSRGRAQHDRPPPTTGARIQARHRNRDQANFARRASSTFFGMISSARRFPVLTYGRRSVHCTSTSRGSAPIGTSVESAQTALPSAGRVRPFHSLVSPCTHTSSNANETKAPR